MSVICASCNDLRKSAKFVSTHYTMALEQPETKMTRMNEADLIPELIKNNE
jgi:hypothetical protein